MTGADDAVGGRAPMEPQEQHQSGSTEKAFRVAEQRAAPFINRKHH